MANTIGNPLSWLTNLFMAGCAHVGSVTKRLGAEDDAVLPEIKEITIDDLRDALRLGFADFKTFRSDILFICLFYPMIGAILVWMVVQGNLLPLLFPVLSGFALVGPLAAVGLYEMSRRREMGQKSNWMAIGEVFSSPTFGAIIVLGLFHIAIFVVWMVAANTIYAVTLGPDAPVSATAFVQDVLTTKAGWVMAITGMVVGLAFAILVLSISIVSFPILLDRNIGLPMAVITSVRVVTKNPGTIAVWGMIVAALLVVGSIPMLLGLVVVMPVLGHATWHLYRKAVVS